MKYKNLNDRESHIWDEGWKYGFIWGIVLSCVGFVLSLIFN